MVKKTLPTEQKDMLVEFLDSIDNTSSTAYAWYRVMAVLFIVLAIVSAILAIAVLILKWLISCGLDMKAIGIMVLFWALLGNTWLDRMNKHE